MAIWPKDALETPTQTAPSTQGTDHETPPQNPARSPQPEARGRLPGSLPLARPVITVLWALSLLAFLGNYFSLSLHYGLDFTFGSVFVLIAAALFGPWWAAGVALIGSLHTIWLWNPPYAVFISISEAIIVGVLYRRSQRSLLLLDGAYWFVAAVPIAWVVYGSLLHFTDSQTYLVFAKDAVNGLLNALFAGLLLSVASARGWLVQLARVSGTTPPYDRKPPLAHTLFNVMVSTILVPTVLLTVVNGQQARSRIESEIDSNLETSGILLADVTRRWHENHRNALRSIVQRYNDEGQVRTALQWQNDLTFVQRTLPDFNAVYATDTKGRTFAHEPKRGPTGHPTPALNFARQSYFLEMQRTGSEVTSGVYVGGGIRSKPTIYVGVPFYRGSRWAGMVAGAVDMFQISRLLRSGLTQRRFQASLIDSKGRVLVSTRPRLKAGSQYDRRAANRVLQYQWSPSGRNLAAVRRWSSSYRIRRVPIRNRVPWDLYIEAPYRDAQRELDAVYAFNLSTALALIAGAFIIAFMLASALSSPLDELAHATTDLPTHLLGRGAKAAQKWPQSRVREIDRLIGNFRSMEASLRRTIQDNMKARADLEAERSRLDAANRLKDDFLAVLSHELRTPLVPVLGYADLIARGVLKGDDATEAARSVERNARAQLRLIEDLLDVSAIMSDKIKLQMGVVNLQMLTREVGETLRTRAHDAEIGLFFDLDESTPFFWGDAGRLRQVVWHLVSNAVKFTPSGGQITVKLVHHENRHGEKFATLTVTDTGIGIEPSFLPHAFDRFRQAGDHMTRHAGGLGLGLAIAHHFVEMHGGTITASSPGEDRGSVFTIILPLRAIPKESF